MRKLAALLLATGLFFAVASPSQAGVLDPANSTLTFTVGGLPQIVTNGSGGSATLTNDGGGSHILTDSTGIWQTAGNGPGTSFFTGVPAITNLTVTLTNQAGSFQEGLTFTNPIGNNGVVGPVLGGNEPLAGQSVIGIQGFAMPLIIPLTAVGGATGATAMGAFGPVNITATNNGPWHTGTQNITGISTNKIQTQGTAMATGAAFTLNPAPGTAKDFTTMGGFVQDGGTGLVVSLHTVTVMGTNNLASASKPGTITLVSPLRINTGPLAGIIPGNFEKKFVFVPEPGALVLIVAGAAGLAIVGRKRMKG